MNNERNLKGIEEGRAIFAYNCVKDVCENEKDTAKYYKAYVKRIPAMIKSNGIGPTIAFIYSKGKNKNADKNKSAKNDDNNEGSKNAYSILYDNISDRLKEKELLKENPLKKEEDLLIRDIVKLDSLDYFEITTEILRLLNWMSKFADGMIEGDASDKN